ncbi:hypothetical protein [Microbacterium maritypicum]
MGDEQPSHDATSRRSSSKEIDIGRAVAAERGLNDPALEAAYGKLESAFSQALPRLLDFSTAPMDTDLRAVREYAVLMHDRYPALRGSSADEHGVRGGNVMMVPNPANWGYESSDSWANLATVMDRERLKVARRQLLPVFAQLLPPVSQVFRAGSMLLGDAGIHAITLHPNAKTERTYVALPLSSDALIVFGNQPAEDDEVLQIARSLPLKVAMESTVLIDTKDAPVISGFVMDMWGHQREPSGAGLPKAIRVFNRMGDVFDHRPSEAQSSS